MNRKVLLSSILISAGLLGFYESKIEAAEKSVKIEAQQTTNQIENINYVSLTELSPEYVKTGNNSPLKVNKNLANGTIGLKLDNQTKYFEEGLTSQATSTLIYDVSQYHNTLTHFRTYCGVDISQPNGEVKFVISGSNDKEHWTELKTIDRIKGNQNAQLIDVEIKDYKYIKLYADQLESDWWDHAVYANPMLCKENYVQNDKVLSTLKTVNEYDNKIENQYKKGEDTTKDVQDLLRLRTFVARMNYNNLQRTAEKSRTAKEAIEYLINNNNGALDLWLQCGTLERGGSALSTLNEWVQLYAHYKNDFSHPLFLKLAIATAITHGNSIRFWTGNNTPSKAIERYAAIKYLYEKEYMKNGIRTGNIKDFESLPMELIRWITNNNLDNKELIWLAQYALATKQKTLGLTYLDAYHYITYRKGYDYSKDIFHNLNKAPEYNLKYHFSSLYDSKEQYQNKNVQHLWQVFEDGAVCGGISKTYANVNQVFGSPAAVVGQPAHASTLVMDKQDNKIHWTLQNDVGTVARAEKGERLPLEWGSVNRNQYKLFCYNVPYVYLASTALDDEKNYYKANQYCLLADIFNNVDERFELYKKALTIQPYNLDALYGILTCLIEKKASDKTFYDLGKYVAEAWKNYPTPFKDMMDNLKAQIKDSKYDLAIDSLISKTLHDMKNRKDSDYVQATECRSTASFLIGDDNNEVATFSFDGNDAGVIKLNEQYQNSSLRWEYTLDNWKTKKQTDVKELKLSKEELEKINDKDNIIISLVGTDATYTIDIKKGQLNKAIHVNDLENRLIGQDVKLEYRTSNDDDWKPYTAQTKFYGDQTVQVRTQYQGQTIPSDCQTYEFKASPADYKYRYINLSDVNLYKFSSQQNDSDSAAKNMLDGNKNTLWHNSWGGDDHPYYAVQFNKERSISKVDYLPRQDGSNGRLKKMTLYSSQDGKEWTKVETFNNIADNNQLKEFKLSNPVKTRYLLLHADESYGGKFFTGQLLNFYEDLSTEMPQWENEISHCSYLSENEQKQALQVLIETNNAQVVEKVTQENEKRYTTAVNKVKAELKTLTFISESQEKEIVKKLDDHLNKEQLIELHEKILQANQQNKIDELEDAHRYVDNIEDLNEQEKELIDQNINQVKSHQGLVSLMTIVKNGVVDRVTTAYNKAKALIQSERELTPVDDKAALEALNHIDTVAEANTIFDKVKEESDQLLSKRKEEAKTIINDMTFISNIQKEQVLTAIQHVQHSNELTAIIDETQSYEKVEMAKDLEASKAKAKEVVTHTDAFNETEKEKMNTAIDKAESKENVAKLSKQIVTEQLTRVNKAKEETKKQLVNADLTVEEQKQFDQELAKADTIAEVQTIGQLVKEWHEKNLSQVKGMAKDFVNELLNLTANDRQQLVETIEKATDYDQIETVLKQAIKDNQNQLEQAKQDAKNTINTLTHLENKDQWVDLVKQTETVNDVKQLVDLAKQADEWYKNDLTEVKAKATSIIDGFKNMMQEDKKAYKEKIDAAKSNEDLETIMTDAVAKEQVLYQEALTKAQNEANKKVDAMKALTDEQRAMLKEEISQSKTVEAINTIVQKAQKQNDDMEQYEFKVYKDTVKENIDQLDELSFIECRDFKEKVDIAKTKREVQEIFAAAQAKNTENAVNKAIDIATKTIASLTGLTGQQRHTFTRQVQEADSIEEVNQIVAQAKAQEKENKKKPTFHKKEQYIHFKDDSYTLWKDLDFKVKKGHSKDYMNQTLKMKGYYNVNKQQYASIYNNDNQWLGYINMDNVAVDKHAGGEYISFNRYVTVTKNNYTLWKDFDFDTKKGTTKSMVGHTYLAKGYYRHFNGNIYYSLYNSDNKWLGYINKDGVALGKDDGTQRVGRHQSVKQTKQIVKKNYTLWNDFGFDTKKGNSTSWYKKKVYVSGQYEHINGSIYYSVYDKQGGKWLGYINHDALK